MELKDYHVHSTYSDGKNSVEEIILAAIDKGLTEIGISDHSYTFFDESYCMRKDQIDAYKNEISILKEKYKDKISVLCGIEQDLFSEESTEGYDYIIGSVHYIKVGNEYIPVDETPTILKDACDKYFNGDIYLLVEAYYAQMKDLVPITHCTIIGHFDLITKFNEKNHLFDEQNERYITAFTKACDILLKEHIPFEINMGAIARGYKTIPFPGIDIADYIKRNNGSFIYSSDCHSKDNLCYLFPKQR